MAASLRGLLRLAFCVSGIYVFFIIWGLAQQRLTSTTYGDNMRFTSFQLLTWVQAVCAVLVARAALWVRGERPIPFFHSKEFSKHVILMCVTSSFGAPFGYWSLEYLSYPIYAIGKASKLLAVVFVKALFHRGRLPLFQLLNASIITVGIIGFTFSEDKHSKSSTTDSALGILLLAMNLFLDGFTHRTQDHLMAHFKRLNSYQMMYYVFLGQSILLGGFLMTPLTTQVEDALTLFRAQPTALLDVLMFGTVGAVGQIFIFLTMHWFGAVTLATVTVTRKMVSVVLSIVVFNYSMSGQQWICVAIVFVGILLEAFEKSFGKKHKLVPVDGHVKHRRRSSVSHKHIKTD